MLRTGEGSGAFAAQRPSLPLPAKDVTGYLNIDKTFPPRLLFPANHSVTPPSQRLQIVSPFIIPAPPSPLPPAGRPAPVSRPSSSCLPSPWAWSWQLPRSAWGRAKEEAVRPWPPWVRNCGHLTLIQACTNAAGDMEPSAHGMWLIARTLTGSPPGPSLGIFDLIAQTGGKGASSPPDSSRLPPRLAKRPRMPPPAERPVAAFLCSLSTLLWWPLLLIENKRTN